MADITKKDLQDSLEGLARYLVNRRNFLAQDLYRQMHRNDCLGNFGDVYCHNEDFDIHIRISKIKK